MHSSIDRAAITTLQYYNPASIRDNREFGGSICSTAPDRYYASFPNEGIGYSDTVIPTGCGPGVRVGDYHTHARDGNDGFSGPDIERANNDHVGDFYMHYFVATPCGRIYKYRGPNGTVIRLNATTETPLRCSP